MAVLYQVCPDGQEKELGRTECLMNNISELASSDTASLAFPHTTFGMQVSKHQ